MNVEVIGGSLYQWDTNRQIKIINTEQNVNEVHYSFKFDSEAIVVIPKIIGGVIVADIPNIHLQRNGFLNVFIVSCDGSCVETIDKFSIHIELKQKPSDYVYTPTEVKKYSDFETRVKALEDYIKSNPRGPKGDTGPKGDPGPRGLPGNDGLSAYEVAVKNGFKGSESEWLESLHGSGSGDGEAGNDGLSAYEIAVKNGFKGSESEWLESLKGPQGNDYILTSADKTEISEMVVDLLPVYNGEVVEL